MLALPYWKIMAPGEVQKFQRLQSAARNSVRTYPKVLWYYPYRTNSGISNWRTIAPDQADTLLKNELRPNKSEVCWEILGLHNAKICMAAPRFVDLATAMFSKNKMWWRLENAGCRLCCKVGNVEVLKLNPVETRAALRVELPPMGLAELR